MINAAFLAGVCKALIDEVFKGAPNAVFPAKCKLFLRGFENG